MISSLNRLKFPLFHEIRVCACIRNCVCLFATPWTTAYQIPVSMEFSRQEYWNGLPLPSPVHLSDPGVEPTSPVSLALPGGFFYH